VPTVNVVTDSLHPGSLFGGVATTIILASRLAERVGGRIRVVTRTQESDAADVARVLRYYQVPDDFEIETVLAGPRNNSSVPLGEREYFMTTAWWTAAPTVSAVGYRRVVHMLQEDERIFYPLGDEYVRCAETLADPRLRVAVNSEILFRHLTGGAKPLPDLSSRAVVFEPAFPEQLFYDDQEARDASGRRNFFFYARPHNVRNLFWRGLEAIERALIEGVLDPAEWRFFFVGKDLQPIYHLPGGPEVVVAQNLSLPAYAELARQAHVGLNLIYSPHPSYPPLDLAASGAVVVTNRFDDTKLDLSSYSKNILCVGTSVNELREGISAAVALAANEEKRLKHVADSGIRRDWCATLAPVVEQVLEWCDG
jgi:hypothetical protein